MARYHVRADGSMGVCTAREGNCPFGSEEGTRHFTNKADAERFSEERVKVIQEGAKLGSSLSHRRDDASLNSHEASSMTTSSDDTTKNAGGPKNSGVGSEPPVPPKTSTAATGNGDSNRTASVTANPYEGLDPSYDPEEYSAEDARRLYEDDVKILRQAGDRPYGSMWTQDSQGKGPVIPIPNKAKQSLAKAISYVNQGLGVVEVEDPSHECSEEFSTYFAKPDSYVMTKFDNGDDYASADMSGLIRKVDPDSEEAEKILKSGNYLDVADTFSEFDQAVKADGTTFTELEEDYLYDSIEKDGKCVMNRVQTAAIEWKLIRYPDYSGALVRHDDEIYVLR